MPFEKDGRYNQVFDLADEGREIADTELRKVPHMMIDVPSPRGRGSQSPLGSPLGSPGPRRGARNFSTVNYIGVSQQGGKQNELGLTFESAGICVYTHGERPCLCICACACVCIYTDGA